MYLQLTTRCNMSCEHCAFSCTKDGEDMSMDIFYKSLTLCEEFGDIPFLGGGEPTLHPNLSEILLESIVCASQIDDGGPMGIVTNGSITKIALKLVALTKGKGINAELSQDVYLDTIDSMVI